MKKVLILAQTPPPYHGQSIMQQYLVEAEWDWCIKKHIRLDYSDNISSVGKMSLGKVLKLFKVIIKVLIERLKGKIDVVFYPPAGPTIVPFIRDCFTLSVVKCCTGKIIFQFHAGNFDGLLEKLNSFGKLLAKYAYSGPSAGIVLLPFLKNEIQWINPQKVFIVPNGLPDIYGQFKNITKSGNCVILFVGNYQEKKGVLTCLKAAKILKDCGITFKWNFMGGWKTEEFKSIVEKQIEENGLEDCVKFIGVKVDDDKWMEYAKAHIFCLPTYETEAMPMTIIEAMMMSLPVVSTNWRTIPDMVDDNTNGLLVPVNEPNALAEKLKLLIIDSHLRAEMGYNGRRKYLSEYTLAKHLSKIEEVFKEITFK